MRRSGKALQAYLEAVVDLDLLTDKTTPPVAIRVPSRTCIQPTGH